MAALAACSAAICAANGVLLREPLNPSPPADAQAMVRSRLRRVSGARKALLRSLVTALFQYGRITTTESKAKELRHVADKMISLAKRGDLHARRQAEAFIMDKAVTKKLFDETAKKYTERNGGYTRVLKLEARLGDNAPQAIIELVD